MASSGRRPNKREGARDRRRGRSKDRSGKKKTKRSRSRDRLDKSHSSQNKPVLVAADQSVKAPAPATASADPRVEKTVPMAVEDEEDEEENGEESDCEDDAVVPVHAGKGDTPAPPAEPPSAAKVHMQFAAVVPSPTPKREAKEKPAEEPPKHGDLPIPRRRLRTRSLRTMPTRPWTLWRTRPGEVPSLRQDSGRWSLRLVAAPTKSHTPGSLGVLQAKQEQQAMVCLPGGPQVAASILLSPAATCSHLQPLEWPQVTTSGRQHSLVTGSHLQPLAATRVAASDHKWPPDIISRQGKTHNENAGVQTKRTEN